MLDIEVIRNDCPACRKRVHFNNAGSAFSPEPVTQAVMEHLRREQELGGYEAANAAETELENFYQSMARLLGCEPGEIAYIENATRAWDTALHAVPWQAGDEILTGDTEYASNYLGLLHLARRHRIKVTTIPRDDTGLIDLERLEQSIGNRTRLIALTHVASQRGDIQPAEAVGEISRRHNLLFLLDACQSAGQLVLNVDRLGCDFLCGTGRKYLRGPRGTGFLYVRQSRLPELQPVCIDLHAAQWTGPHSYRWRDDARRFENFERFVAGQIGLGKAVQYALDLGMEAIQSRVQNLAASLWQQLQELPNVTVLEQAQVRSGIVTFTKADEAASALHGRLQSTGFNTSVTPASSARLDIDREGYAAINRASVHYYNTEDEVRRFVDAIGG